VRIGVLTSSYPRHPGDHAGRFVADLTEALVARGHRLDVLTPAVAGPEVEEREGVRVERVPYLHPRRWQRTFYGAGAPENLRRDPRAWLGAATFPTALARAARRRPWDALLSHWLVPGGLVGGRVRGRRPHLAVAHSGDLHLLAQLPVAVSRRIVGGCTALWGVSAPAVSRLLRRVGAAASHLEVATGPMGVRPAPPLRRPPRDRLTVLTMGRLVPIKGVDRLIDALADLDGVDLEVLGEGPERRHLEARARRAGVRARFRGVLTGRQKARALAEADVFALPSRVRPSGRTEGVPVSALEAAMAGLPLVLSPVGGLPHVFGPHGARYPQSVAGLRHTLEALRDPARRRSLGVAGRRVAAAHTTARTAERMEALLYGSMRRASPGGR
jgi:glycosyltransferase involved in cell wall biosynthesis